MIKGAISSRIEALCRPTIWQQVVSLAQQTKGVSLSQGAPQFGPQPFFISNMQKASKQPIKEECDTKGIPQLRRAISAYHERQYGKLDQNRNILITGGASTALFCLFMSFIDPGDQVLLFEPTFDFYRHYASIFKAKTKNVKLISKDKNTRAQVKSMLAQNKITSRNWQIDWSGLKAKLTDKTKLIIINSPHNPTGKIFTQQQIDRICQLAVDLPDLVIVEDCVYEGFMFDEFKGKYLPKVVHSKYYSQLKQRVVNVYSAGKLLQATGVRCGWMIGPQAIISLCHKLQENILANISCMVQKAIAYCLQDIVREKYQYLDLQATRCQNHREQLLKVLADSKYDLRIAIPKSGYFILVDISEIKIKQQYFQLRVESGSAINPRDLAFCYQMAYQDGVIVVPCSSFFSQQNKQQNYVRFAFCKRIQVIRSAKLKLSS